MNNKITDKVTANVKSIVKDSKLKNVSQEFKDRIIIINLKNVGGFGVNGFNTN